MTSRAANGVVVVTISTIDFTMGEGCVAYWHPELRTPVAKRGKRGKRIKR